MAVKKTNAKGKRSKSKAVVNWEDQLATQAETAAQMEANTGGGQFFGLQSGVLNWQGNPLPNNEMPVIILDTVMENVFYEGDFDPDNPAGPTCFAFGREEGEMAPHTIVTDAGMAQSTEGCEVCEHNEWGSADKGKGKACRNTRRLAIIPAGNFNREGEFECFDEDHFQKAEIAFMKLPVTSVKGYASFVKQIAGTLRRPPHGIFTRIYVEPDAKSQFKVNFEALDDVPNKLMGVIMERHEEAAAVIDFPYTLGEEETAAPSRSGRKAARKAPAKKKAAAKKKRGSGSGRRKY